MTFSPTPADMPKRARFAAVATGSIARTRAAPAPTGWADHLPLPPGSGPHTFLDTGIYHSIADSFAVVGAKLVPMLDGHEPNATIASEVRSQREGSLPSVRDHLLPVLESRARGRCEIQVDAREVGAIRDELIADAQLRHVALVTDQRSRDKHGGEAELIHMASRHTPAGTLATNDAGASAVAAKRGVASIHFGHVVRAAVRARALSLEEALRAVEEGLRTSGLATRERRRTGNQTWLTN